MQSTKSLKLGILALLFVAFTIFSGCAGTTPPINHPPTIISLTADTPNPIEVNQSTTITCYASDQDNDQLTYTWTMSGGTIAGSGSAAIWTAPATAGTYTITCTISDGELFDVQAISIVVTESESEPEPENQAPSITFIPGTTVIVGETFSYSIEAADPDGDTLTYSFTACPVSMIIDSTTGVITWTPTAAGGYYITVEVSDGELSAKRSFVITVSPSSVIIVYRALCVGVGDYLYSPDDACGSTDLLAPPYDVDRMRQTLGYSKFGLSNTEFSNIAYLKDGQATKSNILQKITSTFSDADSNDISYFYFSGHGMRYENTSYLCPVEISCSSLLEAYISVDELEAALSAIPGTKVVFIDSCYSGGFIGKGREGGNKTLEEKLISFNEDVINIFSFGESKGLLTTNQYKVLTACRYSQFSWGFEPEIPGDFDPFGLFTAALCEGSGYNSFAFPYPADDNLDNKVSLHEAYMYIKSWVEEVVLFCGYSEITQEVQVYPSDSDFTIVEY